MCLWMTSGCTQRSQPLPSESRADSTRADSPTSQPTPHQAPSSQPTTQRPSSLGVSQAQASALTQSAWGEARFNQPVNPSALHRVEENMGVAVFAGGCFWCMEAPFESLEGVVAVYSGYTGGERARPTYAQVSASATRHLEAVVVFYHPDQIKYDALLKTFWRSINPTQVGGQFADHGPQYETAIFAVDDAQREAALESKGALERSGKFNDPIAVKVLSASTFWPAEDYHQDYYKTHSAHYKRYKYGSGRAGYLKRVWGVE